MRENKSFFYKVDGMKIIAAQMHLKSTDNKSNNSKKNMASLNDDGQQQQHHMADKHKTTNSSNNSNNNSESSNANGNKISNNINNHNNNNNNSNNGDTNLNEVKVNKTILEIRKQELEKLLNEKSWLLQQIQKQETQIINGNYEFVTLNEFFTNLAQQYKQEQNLQALAKGGSGSSVEDGNQTPESALMRRKQTNTTSKENLLSNNNRHSELSNRSSEYDNYQPNSVEVDNLNVGILLQQQQQQQTEQLLVKTTLKKRGTLKPQSEIPMGYIPLHWQQQQPLRLQQHVEVYPYAITQPQQATHLHLAPHRNASERDWQQQQQSPQTQKFDGVSLFSVNSASVATLRQQHVAPQQQPIIVQCDKYYLSPTHHSYNEGGFIKSSQNIKKYTSPLGSPTTHHYEMPHQLITQQQPLLQQLPNISQTKNRPIDIISLAPSYVSMDAESNQQLRWRSQTHIPPLTPPQLGHDTSLGIETGTKAHSSDMLAHISSQQQKPHHYTHFQQPTTVQHHLAQYSQQSQATKPKPPDEISLSSLNSEKKPKAKQWLESSLDGPVIRTAPADKTLQALTQSRDRAKLSSQSMSASNVAGPGGRHYSMSSARAITGVGSQAISGNTVGLPTKVKQLQNDDGRYVKLSQSTSFLNSMENATSIGISTSYPLESLDIPPFRYLPPKPNTVNPQKQSTPPPRPPPITLDKVVPAPTLLMSSPSVGVATLTPDIRIESPKNMTIVQQATFQPYKEVTKPFEMSDFYKYSTKFKHKDQGSTRQASPISAHLDGN